MVIGIANKSNFYNKLHMMIGGGTMWVVAVIAGVAVIWWCSSITVS